VALPTFLFLTDSDRPHSIDYKFVEDFRRRKRRRPDLSNPGNLKFRRQIGVDSQMAR